MDKIYQCEICGFTSTNWELAAVCQNQGRRSWLDGQLALFRPAPANNFGKAVWRVQIMSVAYYQTRTNQPVYLIKALEADEKIRAAYSNCLAVSEDRLQVAAK